MRHSDDPNFGIIKIFQGSFKTFPLCFHKMSPSKDCMYGTSKAKSYSIQHVLHARMGTAQKDNQSLGNIKGEQDLIIERIMYKPSVLKQEKPGVDLFIFVNSRKT